MSQPLISARNLIKSFPQDDHEVTVLHGIDVDIHPGEFIAVMGPSGSGKSTLLYALSGMDAISGGSVVVDGVRLETRSQKELAALRLTRMGFVFQQIHLLKNLSLLDNILLPGFLSPGADRDAARQRARDLMARTGIEGLETRTVAQASGGQLQRVGICRALINDPPVLFCDEPTGALNSTSTEDIMDLLGEINAAGTTLVVVTHDVRVAARCARVLFLVDGRIVGDREQGPYDPERREQRQVELSA